MFMRFVQLKVKPGMLEHLASTYETRIIPELQKTKNCLYASLIYSAHRQNECISLTLWKNRADAQAYEQSGLYDHLVKAVRQFTEETSEWRIRLSKDLSLEYQQVPEDPTVKSYVIHKDNIAPAFPQGHASQMYVRIISLKIQPEKMEEFKRIYDEHILPAVRTVKGCRFAFRTEGAEDRNEILSLTIWDSKEDANAYERSGWYEAFQNRVRSTLSELYQWKMKLEQEARGQAATSEDVTVEGYNIATGKTFF